MDVAPPDFVAKSAVVVLWWRRWSVCVWVWRKEGGGGGGSEGGNPERHVSARVETFKTDRGNGVRVRLSVGLLPHRPTTSMVPSPRACISNLREN